MQDLLSTLSTPIVIGLIILVLVALAIVVLLARRRRANQAPPTDPSLGGPVDYTSLPLDEEPSGWRERFAHLSLAGKILAVLVPLLAILGLVALILTLLPTNEPAVGLPALEPVTITVRDAALVRAEPLTVDVDVETTGLPDGTLLTAELLEDGQAFPWLNPEQAQAEVRRNRAMIRALRADGAPQPTEGRRYTVIVRGPDGDASAEAELLIPTVNRIDEAFFGAAAAAPAATVAPTAAPRPTSAPQATAAPTVAPTVAPTAAAELPTGPAASVTNGGNVRRLPIIAADNVVGGVNAGEEVQLLSRTPNGAWYRVRTVRDELGWVSTTLLQVPAETSVPVAPVVTVFADGPLYEQPDTASTELDRVNVDEVVELSQRTADGAWYAATNVRQVAGWVPAELLGIPDEVAQAVPVAP